MRILLKKLLFVSLILLSLIFMVACGDKLSKKEVIEKFVENSKNIKSMDSSIKAKFTKKLVNNSQQNLLEASIETSMILNPLSMKIDFSLPFEGGNIKTYVKDNYVYTLHLDDVWIKRKDNLDDIKSFIYIFIKLYDVVKENINKFQLDEKGGNYIISNIEKDSLQEILKQLPALTSADIAALDDMKTLTLTYVVDKKTFLPISSTISFDVDIDGEESADVLIDVKFSNINNIKEIVLPKEAENAKEIPNEEYEE